MSTNSLRVGRRRTGILRTGLVLATILGLLDVAAGIVQLGSGDVVPVVVAVSTVILGAATLAMVPFAWRGVRWAGWATAAIRAASALTGLPAFFAEGVPAAAVIAASTGIVLAAITATLIAFGMEDQK